MVLAESAGQPAVTTLARSAYEQLARGEEVSYQQLDALVGEVSARACCGRCTPGTARPPASRSSGRSWPRSTG
jgi:hypothetical protein